MTSRLEQIILNVAPGWAANRARARVKAQMYSNAYEAANPSRSRKLPRDYGSGNAAVVGAGQPLRNMARHLERNHDLARGILNTLVRNVVGPNGITIEPQPTDPTGEIHEDLADQLSALWVDWCECPEVTQQFDWARTQQLLCRSWFRDGESLFQLLQGPIQTLDHGTQVPFSIEMIEADLLPFWFDDLGNGILQGVERNAWGRPLAYWLFKQHPGDVGVSWSPEMKRVSADLIRHIKLVDRIGQVRGVSMFATVLNRLDDIKDYEESERVAAKIAASLAAVIKKGDPTMYPDDSTSPGQPRQLNFQPGMILDDLRPGESVEMMDSKRPNTGLNEYRDGQLRAVAAGADVSYSAASKNYNGTYSAQRQELVEISSAYALLSNAFTDQCVRPVWQAFVSTSILCGLVKIPRGMTAAGMAEALYIPPQMPWIDPLKEADANAVLEANCYKAGPEIIRSRGGNPRSVLKQQAAWRKKQIALGIPTNDPKPPAAAPPFATAEAA